MLKIGSFLLIGDGERLKNAPKADEKVITYGMNPKATVTFSAISEDSASICLQRGFINARGEEVQPQEVMVAFDGGKTEEVLQNAVVSLVLGE